MILFNRVYPFRHGDCKLRKSRILTGSAQFGIQMLSSARDEAVNVLFLCVLFAVIQKKTVSMIIDYQQH